MANGNFIVQNGLQIGPLTIDAASGGITTTGNITTTGTVTTFINEIVTGTEAVYGQLSANAGIGSSSTTTGTFLVTGGMGITGDAFHGGNVHSTGTAYLKIPAGTTAQRPGTANVALGMIRYNSDISSYEGYGAGSAWSSLGGVKSVDGYATITAEASAGAGDDVLRFYSGSTGSKVQVAWASAGNISILPTTVSTSSTTGALQVAGGVGIAGAAYVGGVLNVTGATTLSSALTYGGVTLTNSVTGTGKMVLDASPTITGHATIEGVTATGATGTGNFVFSASPTVTGTLTAAAITASGATQVNNTLGVTGVTSITNATASTGSSSGALVVTGGVGVGGDLNVFGNINAASLNTISSSQLNVTAPLVYLTGNLYPYTFDIGMYSHFIGGPANVYAHTGVVRSYQNNYWGFFSNVKTEPTGSVNWSDTGLIWDKVKSGELTLANTTASSSTTTGALVVTGGAGIAGAIYAGSLNAGSGTITTSGTVSAGTLTGTLSTAAQTNVTSVGTLTGLTVSGTIAASTNNNINIGASGSVFATVYATTFSGVSTTAKYADLAENYQGDKSYTPGTVVMFGGSAEVTVADADTTAVAGVVSTNPAHLMNGGLTGANVVALALQGRVPCQVIGPVKKGDILVSAGFGYAKVNNSPAVGTVIGKALQEVVFAGKAVIEVVVGRF